MIGSLRRQPQMLRAYPAASLLFAGIVIELSYAAWKERAIGHLIAYLVAVWLGCFFTDVVVGIFPRPEAHFPIRHSAILESALVVVSLIIGMSLLVFRFSHHWATLHGLARIAGASLLFAFAFPLALAVVFIFFLRYRPADLGVNTRFWYLPIAIHIVFGAITLSVAPQLSHWADFYREEGLLRGLYTGVVTAGLSEEFVRMLLQTRLGRLFKDRGLGFVLATVLWSWMHVPNLHSQSPTTSLLVLMIHSLHIVPIGLLWGYITYRTKSLLPATLVHGLNLWGLQNNL